MTPCPYTLPVPVQPNRYHLSPSLPISHSNPAISSLVGSNGPYSDVAAAGEELHVALHGSRDLPYQLRAPTLPDQSIDYHHTTTPCPIPVYPPALVASLT